MFLHPDCDSDTDDGSGYLYSGGSSRYQSMVPSGISKIEPLFLVFKNWSSSWSLPSCTSSFLLLLLTHDEDVNDCIKNPATDGIAKQSPTDGIC